MKPHPFAAALALGLLAAFLSGCASPGSKGPRDALRVTMPAPGKAKVVFVRLGNMARGVSFRIHDQEKLIGQVTGKTYFVYECEPGKHLFSTSMEDVAILDAELLPDRIYYAKVSASMGWWISQVNMFSLHPNCAGDLWPKLPKLLPDLRESSITPELVEKDASGAANYMERVKAYHRDKYLPNPNREQILPEHGQTKPIGAP